MSHDLTSYLILLIQSLFIKKGGTVFDNCKVTAIHPGDIITLETNKGKFKAKKIVITAGTYNNKATILQTRVIRHMH